MSEVRAQGFRSNFRISPSVLGPSTAASRGPAVGPGSVSAVLGSAIESDVCRGTARRVMLVLFCSLTYSLTLTVPFPAATVQLPAQLPGDGLQVHEVAEAPPGALPVKTTTTC